VVVEFFFLKSCISLKLVFIKCIRSALLHFLDTLARSVVLATGVCFECSSIDFVLIRFQ